MTKVDVEFGLSLKVEPMEARPAAELPGEEGWQYEPKWDGFRCLAFKRGSNVDLRAKSGKSLARYFPEVVAFLSELSVQRFVIDGELVIEIDGSLSFDALQMRLHPAKSRVQKLSLETPARLVVFDMLVNPDGTPILDKDLLERRAALEDFAQDATNRDRLMLSPTTRDIAQAADWLSASGGDTDGVVCKRVDGRYMPGERAMVKVKRLRTADCVVAGFRYEIDSELVGSLLLGLYNEKGELDHVGFTSTISDKERPELTSRLEALRGGSGFTGKAPGGPSRWSTKRSKNWEPLRPELVVEVRFDHVTGRRFRHGTKLLRWRPDKKASQCDYRQMDR
ncbi:ATP-dependent DNA ligase (plasmid) [Ensifer adhaerens]|uniref:ATP-dependent DNA ligase n=1 Tax=Ensifer adhaerens TaxID=106592 RepID=UPI001CC17ACE|nr:ATP-dependent DNA ligase [Ensifer adhaerens]MBZ7927283.1 ATP-dependent DNA ligase [Ensifer adhaerens]UAX98298.1 ATP-dependent DNA ligase [Ensifer adhaerens]UAY05681.1 ATP-dependent DNA ligase [Ensifer adhaerens]UAY13059.1 ATP-dependent DNA ligase [Ensifer adhaerens]